MGIDVLLCLSFTINSMEETQTVKRTNFLFLLGGLGSITYLLRNIGNAVTSGGNAWGLDNSMIKRLYSINREIDGHTLDVVEEDNIKTGR